MSSVISATNLSSFFDMVGLKVPDSFDDRMEVQKIIYLAQEYGIPFGYDFEWYIRGPYCNQVAVDAHYMIDNPGKPKELQLDENKVKEFARIIEPYLKNPMWFEIASSLVYIRNENYPGRELSDVLSSIIEDLIFGYTNFGGEYMHLVFKDVLRIVLIKE